VLDLASGHLLALDALVPGSRIFDNCPDSARYKSYNLGKGRGMSVLQIIEAMRKTTGFDFKFEVIGRRYVDLCDILKALKDLMPLLQQSRRRSRFDS
jgi:UDP-glucose 4-epimerase